MNGLIRFALGLANVPDDLVGDIDKELPGAGRLIAVAKELQPDLDALGSLLEQMAPHVVALQPMVTAALPLLTKITPKLKAAYPDAVALLPVAQRVVAFVEGKK